MDILNEVLAASGAVLGNLVVASIIALVTYKIGLFPDIKAMPPSPQRWGRIFSLLAGFNFVVSGTGKLLAFSPMVAKFTLFNMLHLFTFTGCLEIIIGIVIVVPQTYKIGVLMGTAMCGGAIATHLPSTSDGIIWAIPSSTFLVVLWLSAVLYTPEFFPDYISRWFHKSVRDG